MSGYILCTKAALQKHIISYGPVYSEWYFISDLIPHLRWYGLDVFKS